jgi:hypothetical protein
MDDQAPKTPREGERTKTEEFVEETQSQIGAPAETADPPKTSDAFDKWYARIALTWLYPGIGLAILWFAKRDFVKERWIAIAVIFAVLALVVSIPGVQRAYRRATAQRRIGLIIFSLVPLIVVFFTAVFLIDTKYQTALLRTIFLIVVCSLPALLYYLFIATKKSSLLNEFVMNLSRLGLRDPNRVPIQLVFAGLDKETDTERKDRIYTYIQKFEAVYGAVPTNLGAMLLDPTSPGLTVQETKPAANADSAGISVFTVDTTIPVIIATVLIALGWLITLPPWQGRLEFGRQTTQAAVETQSSKAAAEPTAPPTQLSTGAAVDSGASPAATVSPTPTPKPAAVESTDKWLAVFTPIATPVRFAFLGAYFFALQLLFRRYIRRDLRASAYVAVSLRVIIAVISIWVAIEVVDITPSNWVSSEGQKHSVEKFLLVLGFVIGVFPRVAWQIIQSGVKRVGSIIVPSLETQLPLRDLDGLTVWHEARFEEEDIENIPNMATADLVDLFINTRVPADRIIDWVDQAILYKHLGPDPRDENAMCARKHLAEHGIRNATSLVEIYNNSKFHGDQEEFEKIIPPNGRITMRSLVDAVGTNPNLKLIQTWKGLLPHTHTGA